MLRRLFTGIAGIALVFSAIMPASAQTAANGALFDDWQLTCRAEAVGQTACALVQTLVANDSDTFLAEVGLNLVTNDDGTAGIVMVLRTPSGMLLPARPAFRVGEAGEPRALTWRTCAGDACTAVLPLTQGDLTDLRAGASMIVGYQPINRDGPVAFAVSLRGVTAGLAALGLE